MNKVYKSDNNIVYLCKYHVVWCVKYRRKELTNGVDTKLKQLLLECVASLPINILEVEIKPDYIYMSMEVDPQYGIHKAIKFIKGYTSKILRKDFLQLRTKIPTLWTNSYFLSTSENTPLEDIKQYIEKQKTSQRQKEKLG